MARWKHHRNYDHTGSMDDSVLVLSAAIGPYPAGASVHSVLSGLYDMLIEMESPSTNTPQSFFKASAYIAQWFLASAVVKKPDRQYSFTADAFLFRGGVGTVEASALIFKTRTGTFSASASLVL